MSFVDELFLEHCSLSYLLLQLTTLRCSLDTLDRAALLRCDANLLILLNLGRSLLAPGHILLVLLSSLGRIELFKHRQQVLATLGWFSVRSGVLPQFEQSALLSG